MVGPSCRVGLPAEDRLLRRGRLGLCDDARDPKVGGDDAALVVDAHEGAEDRVESNPGDPEVEAVAGKGWKADAGQEKGDAGYKEPRLLVWY